MMRLQGLDKYYFKGFDLVHDRVSMAWWVSLLYWVTDRGSTGSRLVEAVDQQITALTGVLLDDIIITLTTD